MKKAALAITLLIVLCVCPRRGQAQEAKWKGWATEADTLVNHEQFEQALKLYTRAIDSAPAGEPERYDVLYKRAVCYYYLEHYAEALADIATFIEKYPSVPEAILLRTILLGETGEPEQQLESLNELIAKDPFNARLMKWQGSLLLDLDRYEEAKERLKYAALLHNDAETATYLGLAYMNLDDADSAIFQLDKAIAMDGSYLPAYFYASSFCLDQSAYELALRYVNKGLALDQTNTDLIFYKGIALVELEKKEEGCRYLSQAFYAGNDDAAGYLEEYCYK